MQKNSFINRTRLEDSFLTLNNISFRTEVRHYFKVIFLGSASVGKTSIITRFVDDEISSIYKCTLTVDLKMKSILIDDNTWVELQLWDTCGQEIYNTICRQYYNHTKGCIIVFDMTNRCSFLETEKWIQDILQYAEENVTIILVGNKFDLADKREVTFTEASALAEKFKLDYMEVSTKSSMNINLLFEVLCQQLIKANDESQIISEKKQKNGSLDKTVLYDRRKRRNIHSKEKCC